MIGVLIILEVEDMETAKDWTRSDPYALAGFVALIELHPWKQVIS